MNGLTPSTISKCLLLVYAGGVTLFLLSGADAPDVVLLSFLFLPCFVGPVALAAFMVKRSSSEIATWAFLILEALIIVSTVWAWHYLTVIEPDAQNGIAMMLFPVLQYAAVLAAMTFAGVSNWLVRRTGEGEDQTH